MPTKHASVIHVKKILAKAHCIPVRIVLLLIALLTFATMSTLTRESTNATACPDLKVVFARGSGGERYTSGHYQAFKAAMEQKLNTTSINYAIDDLDYPAVSIDIGQGHLGTLLGAFIGSGDAYDFGDSVHQGTKELISTINNDSCKNTKYVLAGYSQGTLVLLNELEKIDANKIIYIATFGDPKIYLPEGAGFVPSACSGKNLSDYRIHVPDCRAYKGLLGYRDPYVISAYQGKIGTWCNKGDVLCSSHFNIRDHTHYAEDGLYEDASRYIFSKIARTFNIQNQYSSPHDTAILINSTPSLINSRPNYQSQIYHLAERMLDHGGRIAIYSYQGTYNGRPSNLTERCSFSTCKLTDVKTILYTIEDEALPQDDNPLLSSSFHTMQQLNWEFGSTKSLVIFTDSPYLSPDLGGKSFYDVKKLSQQIDPINFYIVTDPTNASSYQSLALATDGFVFSTDEDEILASSISNRFDSLPRVEEEYEDEQYDNFTPTLEINEAKQLSATEFNISYSTNVAKAIVILNDAILGITDQTNLTFTELNDDVDNTFTLVPLADNKRGDPVSVTLHAASPVAADLSASNFTGIDPTMPNNNITLTVQPKTSTIIPKAPNTGRQ